MDFIGSDDYDMRKFNSLICDIAPRKKSFRLGCNFIIYTFIRQMTALLFVAGIYALNYY